MAIGNTNLILRITLDIILLLGLFVLPFWLVAVLAFIGLIVFKNYYEFMVVFAISDFLYAVPLARLGGSVYVLTVASVVVYLIANFIKNKMILSR